MRPIAILHRHPALRWAIPVVLVSLLGLSAIEAFTSTTPAAPLPPVTARALVAELESGAATGYSGTLLAQVSLGLPDLPAANGEGDDLSVIESMVAGSHAMRYWYGGSEQERVALVNPTSETDVFRNGKDVWEWDSSTQRAVHSTSPAARPSGLVVPLSFAALTPNQLTQRLLASMARTTTLSLGPNRVVSDRSAYELILTPQVDSGTRIGSVRICVDGDTKVPLSVQIYPRSVDSAAVDVAFTSITFKAPAPDYFTFSPPPNAQVEQLGDEGGDAAATFGNALASPLITSGLGWASVAQYTSTAADAGRLGVADLAALTPVTGQWGTGHLLDAPLVSVLILPDGRVLVGSVEPGTLFALAAKK